MKPKNLYPIWALLYILCVCLGAISQRSTAVDILFTIISIGFFVPPALLLIQAIGSSDANALRILRLISIASLSLTLLAMIGNILSVLAPEILGNILYIVLLVVSSPMLCCKYWVLPLLLWAMLLFATFPKIWKSK